MQLPSLLVALTTLSHLHLALACSPVPGWREPTASSAFAGSEVVIHARVESKRSYELGQVTKAKITVLRVFKGKFEGDQVNTAGGTLCGIGTFQVGEQYVFFFSRAGDWFVSGLAQPNATTEELLQAIEVLPK